ncbi:DUF4421 family protein [uncultured Kordia sp.]|uniref:DUF4421 family protein n=1 Tax=uncultured Kordia sp. TaxID=507699 RepID=UPI0026338820|nr:DUF4421 family protein [uncultured Kordia sp.]
MEAQTSDAPKTKDTISLENEYFDKLKEKISIRTNFSGDVRSYQIQDSETSLELVPNSEYRLSLTIDYRFLGITLGFSPQFLPGNDDENLKGKTELSNFGLQFYFDKWLQRISYERIKGFYINNTGDFIENWQQGIDPYIQLSGLRTTTYAGNTAYKFNDNFSLPAINGYIHWQKKSAGSFIPSLDYNYINAELKDIGETDIKSNEINITLKPSYFYTFIYQHHWFLSVEISPGIGINFTKDKEINILSNTSTSGNSNGLHYVYDSTLLLGYNSNSLYGGAKYNVKNLSNFDKSEENFLQTENFFEFFIGYRFDAPKLIKKPFDWVEKKTGL